MTDSRPILYSFRRCPYAMRARMALVYSGVSCELREVVLRDKPAALLEVSPKGTVPVLQLSDGRVIDESLDIMRYAISQHDPGEWGDLSGEQQKACDAFIRRNDREFAPLLTKYKYFEKHPEHTQEAYWQSLQKVFLQGWEQQLSVHGYFMGDNISLADVALFPLVRQLALVDKERFNALPMPRLKAWLGYFMNSRWYEKAMPKHAQWQEGDKVVLFP